MSQVAYADYRSTVSAPKLESMLTGSKIRVLKQAKAGRIPSFRVGTCVRFDPRPVAPTKLESWLQPSESCAADSPRRPTPPASPALAGAGQLGRGVPLRPLPTEVSHEKHRRGNPLPCASQRKTWKRRADWLRARGWATKLTSRWCSERRLPSARRRSNKRGIPQSLASFFKQSAPTFQRAKRGAPEITWTTRPDAKRAKCRGQDEMKVGGARSA